MRCAGCQREIVAGGRYIEDTASGFVGAEADPVIDGLLADIFAGNRDLDGASGGTVYFCEDCTDPTREGRWHLKTHLPDVEPAEADDAFQTDAEYDERDGHA